ncbi:nitroreductase family protein [Bifidobacterium choloepi]|uniref:Nitroreductase n=1 Tax=Bifidobacterium choloepi TaxID=2614131 RepID=A0A6I5N1Q5_9BIFI|nr:nitroreductase family protein [Bifidobacterium choloepi]NEG69559.1 nitroreductase [Bifidobacterium choloepi]
MNEALKTMELRHSVRKFADEPLTADEIRAIETMIADINRESGLHFQLMVNSRVSFLSVIGAATYGAFRNVRNYIALVARPVGDQLERLGYYGERLVLKMTEMGLGTCWVGGSLSKRFTPADVRPGERLNCIVMVGHIGVPGRPHRSKTIGEMCELNGRQMPDWFHRGMIGVQLAPSAMNQQRTVFELLDLNQVLVHKTTRPFGAVDAGIAKCHFEQLAGKENFVFVG